MNLTVIHAVQVNVKGLVTHILPVSLIGSVFTGVVESLGTGTDVVGVKRSDYFI